ncbi:MAG: nucleotidyltransferase domain-containing protein [Anaerolineae bacterium]|nr:nucleotidyltransferase domain-containing protein [Anaerolineae bacterium]
MGSVIGNYKNKLSELCHIYGVRRLEVFGSASRHDFDPKRSDIDFLVNFTETHPLGAFEQYFGLKEALEQLFQRPVDLIEEKAIKNPYFKQAIQQDRVLIYETTNPKTAL